MVELLHVVIIVLLRLRVIKAFLLIQKPSTDIMLCIPIWLYTRSKVQFWNYSSPLSSFSQLSNFIFLNLTLYGAQLLNTQDRQLTPKQTPQRTHRGTSRLSWWGRLRMALLCGITTVYVWHQLQDLEKQREKESKTPNFGFGLKKYKYTWNRKIFS